MSRPKEVVYDDDDDDESEGDDCPVGPEIMDRSDESEGDDDKSTLCDETDKHSNEESSQSKSTPYLAFTGRRKEQAVLVLSPTYVLNYFELNGFNPNAEPDSSSDDEDDNDKDGRARQRPIAAQYGLKFKMPKADTIVAAILKIHGFKRVRDIKPIDTWQRHSNGSWYKQNERNGPTDGWNVHWSGSHLKPQFARQLKDYQRVNHFPRSFELTRKDRLFKNIQRMQSMKGLKYFDFVPPSYVMPHDFSELCSSFLKDRSALFIVKPVALSRGRGVFLINSPEQVPLDESHIVSRYISNPLLVDGFKFDLRIYVAVTSFDPLIIYIYEEGLTRFATVKYTTSTRHIRQNCMHLTNYAVNKQNRAFVQNMDADVEDFGNKWSLGALLRYLRKQGMNPVVLMMRIEDVVIKTMIAVEQQIANACRMSVPHSRNCFELFGFDVLIDENLQPWLIEVNLSPSLACDSPLDIKVKTHMLSDLFSLVGIPCGKADKHGQFASAPAAAPAPAGAKTRNPQSQTIRTAPDYEGDSVHIHRLTTDEARFVRNAKEEYARRGGWLRIFPSSYSLQLYGPLFVEMSLRNRALQQNLFPESASPQRTNGEQRMFRGVSLHNLTLNNAGYSTGSHGNHAQVSASEALLFSIYSEVAARCAYYERKLSEPPVNLNDVTQFITPPRNDAPAQTRISSASSSASRKQDAISKMELRARVEANERREKSGKPRVDEPRAPPQAEAEVPPAAKVDFEMGHIQARLTLVQARSLFVRLLLWMRNQLNKQLVQRDASRASPPVRKIADSDYMLLSDDQVEAIAAFLKKASRNLSQPSALDTPNRSLTHDQRCVHTAKLVDEFIALYKKESEALKNRLQSLTLAKSSDQLDKDRRDDELETPERSVKVFLRSSSIVQLTSVLLNFARRHSNTAVLLGVSPYSLGTLLESLFDGQTPALHDSTGHEAGPGRPMRQSAKQSDTYADEEDQESVVSSAKPDDEMAQSSGKDLRDGRSRSKLPASAGSRSGARNPTFGSSAQAGSVVAPLAATKTGKVDSDKLSGEQQRVYEPLKVSTNVNVTERETNDATRIAMRTQGPVNARANNAPAYNEWSDVLRPQKVHNSERNGAHAYDGSSKSGRSQSPSASSMTSATLSGFGVRPGYTAYTAAPSQPLSLRSISPDTLSFSSANSAYRPELYGAKSATMSSLRSAAEAYSQRPNLPRPPGHYMIVQSQKAISANRLRRRSHSRSRLNDEASTGRSTQPQTANANANGSVQPNRSDEMLFVKTKLSDANDKTLVNSGMPPAGPAHARLVAKRPRAPGTLLSPRQAHQGAEETNGSIRPNAASYENDPSGTIMPISLNLALAASLSLSASRPGSASGSYAERALQKLNERSQSRLYNSSKSPLF